MNELELYRANVERLVELGSQEVFGNGRAEHAAIIFETFFKYAKNTVVIFCHDLSDSVFNSPSLVTLAECALRRKVNFKILTQQAPKADAFITASKRWIEEELPISLTTSRPESPAVKARANFAVMDGRAYRFEQDFTKPEAAACMCDTSACEKLLSAFSMLERVA